MKNFGFLFLFVVILYGCSPSYYPVSEAGLRKGDKVKVEANEMESKGRVLKVKDELEVKINRHRTDTYKFSDIDVLKVIRTEGISPDVFAKINLKRITPVSGSRASNYYEGFLVAMEDSTITLKSDPGFVRNPVPGGLSYEASIPISNLESMQFQDHSNFKQNYIKIGMIAGALIGSGIGLGIGLKKANQIEDAKREVCNINNISSPLPGCFFVAIGNAFAQMNLNAKRTGTVLKYGAIGFVAGVMSGVTVGVTLGYASSRSKKSQLYLINGDYHTYKKMKSKIWMKWLNF